MLARRSFVVAALLAWPGASARAFDVIEEEFTDLAGIGVPAQRVRMLATLKLGGTPVPVLGFAADVAEGVRDLFAVVANGRVVALEVLAWHGADGARLSTRLSAVTDGVRLRLERTASARWGKGTHHEEWIDYLAWQAEAPMADAPVRPVLAGTWQAALAAQRAAMRTMLAVGPRSVGPALIAACPPPCFAM